MKKADKILIFAVLLLAMAAFLVMQLTKKEGSQVVVTVDGEETARYPLAENRTEELAGIGGSNTLVIEDGEARVTEADCPDKICVRESAIRYNGQTIVCLPHKLVVTIEGGEEPEVDGVAS